MSGMQEIALGVACLPVTIGNVYFIGEPGSPWTLVDTGTPGGAGKIRAAAASRYGGDTRPEAILLTHGHTDHVGSALGLADLWNVPVYAHPLELPYLTGKSRYPPKDPTVGGAMAMLSRVFPMDITNLESWIEPLPAGGVTPRLPDWEWLPTPGHSPGHVCYFRRSDSTLLAGDAFATVNLAALTSLLTKKPELSLPPTSFTCDWQAAEESVQLLARLKPFTVGCGHGLPLSGPRVAADLADFADMFIPPAHGRYVEGPAKTDQNGVISVPPPAPDPFPAQAAIVAAMLALIGGWWAYAKRRKR